MTENVVHWNWHQQMMISGVYYWRFNCLYSQLQSMIPLHRVGGPLWPCLSRMLQQHCRCLQDLWKLQHLQTLQLTWTLQLTRICQHRWIFLKIRSTSGWEKFGENFEKFGKLLRILKNFNIFVKIWLYFPFKEEICWKIDYFSACFPPLRCNLVDFLTIFVKFEVNS